MGNNNLKQNEWESMEQTKIAGVCHFYLDLQTVDQYQNTIFLSDLKGNDSHPVGPIWG